MGQENEELEKTGVFVDHDVATLDRPTHDWTPDDEKQVRRKIDARIFPMLCILYGLSLLDRVNMSASYIAGMGSDLHLADGSRYNLALLAFFLPFFVFDIPSNMVIRRIGARFWLAFLVTIWGLSVMCMGFVRDWKTLVGLRVVLGAFEGGLLPGAVFVLTSWYRQYETATRITVFFMTSQAVAAFGPILSYALSMISVGNGMYTASWRWIFIVEGIITVCAGLISPIFLADFPERAKFLNDREIYIAQQRVRVERDADDVKHPSWREVLTVILDWKLLAYAIIYFITTSSLYSLASFAPIILREGLHFSYAKAQLLTTPPYVVSAILSICGAYLSDRIKLRWPIMIFQALSAIAGLLIMLYTPLPSTKYFGVFLATYGACGNTASVLSYVSNQTAKAKNRGIVSAFVTSFGALGGICGSTIFRSHEAPLYLSGMWATVALSFLFCGIVGCLTGYFGRMNRLADEGKISTLEGVEGFRYAP